MPPHHWAVIRGICGGDRGARGTWKKVRPVGVLAVIFQKGLLSSVHLCEFTMALPEGQELLIPLG